MIEVESSSTYPVESGSRIRLLIVDDDVSVCELYDQVLTQDGFLVSSAGSIEEARRQVAQSTFDVVLLDIGLGNENGLGWISYFIREAGGAQVMILTSNNSVSTAVLAMQKGATGFFTKDMDVRKVGSEVRALCTTQARVPALPNSSEKAANENFGMLGVSAAIAKIVHQIRKMKDVASTVLITGDSGCGKELVARALHEQSNRRGGFFAAINCGAIPEQLLESELFGHRRGAFTDAKADRKGLFELCSGGTLLLDEIGDMPPLLQVKLLRVLQEREIRPVGGSQSIRIDTRVVAATHRNLDEEVRAKYFRHDLFYRLSVLHIHIPALKERKEDIPILAHYFLDIFRQRFNLPQVRLSSQVLDALCEYSWPGNVRELQNVIERGVVLSEEGDFLLPPNFGEFTSEIETVSAPNAETFEAHYGTAKETFEKHYVLNLLRRTHGNISEAARLSGQHRPQIYRWIHRYGIDPSIYKLPAESEKFH